LIIFLLIVWPIWAGFYTTWLWFRELGYQNVFTTTLVTKVALGLTVGVIAAAFTWLNFSLALRQSPEPLYRRRVIRIEGQEMPAPDFARYVGNLTRPAALVIGAFMGSLGWSAWDILLRYRHQVPFGEADPIFGRDIGFYFFTLPALETVTQGLFL